ncbi:unnamed protein product [Orchesella dallaii]|uniref:Uncharacterized protein n=1 Tax=Orchesella dallaii TaxID=48710 RepID=A0ABP1RYV0_9HEXA
MEESISEVVGGLQNINLLTTDEKTRPQQQQQKSSDHYDYFSPALMDCWPSVVGNLTAPGDFVSLANTCRPLNSLLQVKLASLVLPIVIKKGYLSRNSLLSTRRLNKESRQAVDDYLIGPSFKSKHAWLSSAFRLETKAEITRFLEKFAECPLKNGLPSKLLRLGVYDTESLDLVADLLQRHGTHLKNFGVELFFAENISRICLSLTQLMSLVPNAQSLLFKMGIRSGYDHRYPDPIEISLPPLKTLTNLTLVAQTPGLTPLLEKIVHVYGPQLKELSLHPHLTGYEIKVSNWHLDNLTKLEVSNIDCFKIIHFKMPKVTTLSFADGYIGTGEHDKS